MFGMVLALVGLTASTALAEGTSLRELGQGAPETPLSQRLTGVLGLVVLVAICWLLSRNRRAIRWRPVLWGLALQVIIGLVVLAPAVADLFFDATSAGIAKLMSFSEQGSDFVFQTIVPQKATTVDLATGVETTTVVIGHIAPALKTVAFWILPTIIFFSALMAVLYHLGVMQWVVRGMSWVMERTLGTSGAETLSTASNIFLGQTESPLLVRPFVEKMTRSELHSVMVGGFGTVAGGVLAAYVGFLQTSIPDIAGHLVIASIMSAPACLVVAKLLVPETELAETRGGSGKIEVPKTSTNVIEALANGTTEGLTLFLNVIAMLIAFVAMTALVNATLGWAGGLVGLDLSLQKILGWIFAPIAWCIGIPWSESQTVGQLLGEKTVLTELIAYLHLGEILKEPGALSYRSAVITSYALCGFANFASIGIQLGGIGALAPSRRKDLAELGLIAMVGGTIATLMAATIVGIIL